MEAVLNGRRKFDITEHRYLDKCELGLLVPLDLDTGRHVGAGPVPPPLSSLLLHVVVFDPCAAASKDCVFFGPCAAASKNYVFLDPCAAASKVFVFFDPCAAASKVCVEC